jgi:glycosyltransferase involved in cell wall biosynthesis
MASLSVVLPFRDAAATLDEAVQSVLEQEEVDLELVLVDDASRDGGPRIAEAHAKRDARVRLLRGEGGGLVSALALGCAHAQGAYLARMDADDIARPRRLAASLARMTADPSLAVVSTQVAAFPEEAVGEGLRRYVAWQNAIVTPEDHARAMFVESPVCHPSVLMARRAFEAVGGYRDAGWAEDYDLWLRFDAAGFRFAKVPEVLLLWRHAPGRQTFENPLYALSRFTAAKAHYLAPRLRACGRDVVVWGAGPTGKRFARALEPHGVFASRFVDIDPRKVGRRARGAPIEAPASLRREREIVVVAVGSRGARLLIQRELDGRGYTEGEDYVCVA